MDYVLEGRILDIFNKKRPVEAKINDSLSNRDLGGQSSCT